MSGENKKIPFFILFLSLRWWRVIRLSISPITIPINLCSFKVGHVNKRFFMIAPDKLPCPPWRYVEMTLFLLFLSQYIRNFESYSVLGIMAKIAWLMAPFIEEIATSPLVAPYSAYKISPFFTSLADDSLRAFSFINNSVFFSDISPDLINGILPI